MKALAFAAAVTVLLSACHAPPTTSTGAATDPLPSWGPSASRAAIVEFVARVTDPASADFVPAEDRIAVFDNDGTLWCEQPLYTQLAFALDRVRELAAEHPEWQTTEPFRSILEGDVGAALAAGERGVVEIVMATHAGTDTAEFDSAVSEWFATARHPRTGRPYPGMAYQPMLELLAFLEANGFECWIVSGGGVDFMRTFCEETYGIPASRVIGSTGAVTYEVGDDGPRLMRQPTITFVNDKEGKPVSIQRNIGRRPVIAVGNSDGDFAMLEWTTAAENPALGVLVHHTDADREYQYDRGSHIGRLERGLDEGPNRGWVIVDMSSDWNTIFPPNR